MRKTVCCIMALALVLHGFGLPASLSAEISKKLSCIKLETLIEANDRDFAEFRARHKINISQDGITANEVGALAMMAGIMLFLGAVGSGFVVMSSGHPAMREEFKRLQDKNLYLHNRAFRDNCNVPPSTAPWKAVDEILFPKTTFESDLNEDDE